MATPERVLPDIKEFILATINKLRVSTLKSIGNKAGVSLHRVAPVVCELYAQDTMVKALEEMAGENAIYIYTEFGKQEGPYTQPRLITSFPEKFDPTMWMNRFDKEGNPCTHGSWETRYVYTMLYIVANGVPKKIQNLLDRAKKESTSLANEILTDLAKQ